MSLETPHKMCPERKKHYQTLLKVHQPMKVNSFRIHNLWTGGIFILYAHLHLFCNSRCIYFGCGLRPIKFFFFKLQVIFFQAVALNRSIIVVVVLPFFVSFCFPNPSPELNGLVASRPRFARKKYQYRKLNNPSHSPFFFFRKTLSITNREYDREQAFCWA